MCGRFTFVINNIDDLIMRYHIDPQTSVKFKRIFCQIA